MQFFTHDRDLEQEDAVRLTAMGVPVVTGAVAGLEESDGRLVGVRLTDGRVVEVDAVVVSSRMVARVDVFAGLGIEATAHPTGSFVEADPTGRTSVPGVWVAGNVADLSAQVSAAVAEGARAAQQINAELVMSDTDRAVAELGAGVR